MGICDIYLIGKKHEIERLGEICAGVGDLLRTKYGNKKERFVDWTGISVFLLFHEPEERTIQEQGWSGDDVEESAMEWIGCGPWDKDEAAIWWSEIAWPHKVPSEVWQLMRREGKRLGVQHLIDKLLKEWSIVDDGCFELLEKTFKKQRSSFAYPQ